VKLVVQIPCLNEGETLAEVLDSIPRKIKGFSSVEVVVIDDGSTDETIAVARAHGVDAVIRHRSTRGLAEAFRSGVDYGLTHGADVLVNTDGDNQYPQSDIPKLVAPILAGSADIVVGDRRTNTISHFSRGKKFLQRVGSAVVNRAAGTQIPDAAQWIPGLLSDSPSEVEPGHKVFLHDGNNYSGWLQTAGDSKRSDQDQRKDPGVKAF